MYSLKVSSNDLQGMVHAIPTTVADSAPSTWVLKARELFLGRMASLTANEKTKKDRVVYDDGQYNNNNDDDDDDAAEEESLEDCVTLSENETAIMRLIIDLAR